MTHDASLPRGDADPELRADAAAQGAAGQPDPPRLLSGGTALEQKLLHSASVDAAPGGARARMEAVLAPVLIDPHQPGTGSSKPGAAPASGSSSNGWRAALTPRAALLALAGAGLAAYLLAARLSAPGAIQEASNPDAVTPESVAHGSTVLEPIAPQAQLAPTPVAQPLSASSASTAGAAGAESTEGARLPPVAAPQRRHRQPAAHPASLPPAASGSLLEEVRLLDSVRSALHAQQLRSAARGLEQYDRRFPRGELTRERSVLALELLVASGDREQARTRASEQLAQPGMQRYAAHLRAVRDGASTPGSTQSNQQRGTDGSDTAGAHIRARR